MRKHGRIALLTLFGAIACSSVTGDFDRIIAIEVPNQATLSVEEGDTLSLSAAALDARGDTVQDAPIRWGIVDVDSGQVGLSIDSVTGVVTGVFPSAVRVQATVDNLRTNPITVTVTAAPDSIATASATVTASRTATQSPPLQVQVVDVTTDSTGPRNLTNKTVTFTLTNGPTGTVFLSVGDTLAVGDGSTIDALSSGAGLAVAFLRVVSGATPPDTVLVDASIAARSGAPVAGSPLRFMVLFQDSQ